MGTEQLFIFLIEARGSISGGYWRGIFRNKQLFVWKLHGEWKIFVIFARKINKVGSVNQVELILKINARRFLIDYDGAMQRGKMRNMPQQIQKRPKKNLPKTNKIFTNL